MERAAAPGRCLRMKLLLHGKAVQCGMMSCRSTVRPRETPRMAWVHAAALAASLVPLLCLPGPARCQEGADDSVKYSKEYFDRGIILFKAGDFQGALENFTISYEKSGNGCTMNIDWETTQASVDITAK